jgi:hypothetical protein
MKNYTFYLLFVLSGMTCINSKNRINISSTSEKIPFTSIGDLSSLKAITIEGEEYLSLFVQSQNGKIVLFSRNAKFVREFTVPKINFLGEYYTYSFRSRDTMVNLYERGIVLSTQNGMYRVAQEFPNPYTNEEGRLMNLGCFNFEYMPLVRHNEGYVFPHYSMEINYWNPSFYHVSQFVYFSLSSNTFETLPIYYPSLYYTENYGNANNIVFTSSDQYLFYSANATQNISRYNLTTGNVNEIEISAESAWFKCEPFDTAHKSDMSKIFEHLTINDLTVRLLYDKKNEVVYQLVWQSKKLINKDGSFNSIKDKTLAVNVISSEGKLLACYSVAKQVIWDYSMVFGGKLYLKNKKNENFSCINFFS